VSAEILDSQGRVVPTANNEITFEVLGEGRLIGADSGDPESHEDYRSNRRRAFNGLGVAIVQATGAAGQIRVNATSSSLHAGNVIVIAMG
jgi:beta-galactosidase